MKQFCSAASSRGFSLVELSIVLVILGLLTGGILGGRELIRAAELRSVASDFERYQTAFYTFRDKYFALPGDMQNAYAFWGTAAGCTDSVVTDANPNGCNGDGNGGIGSGGDHAEKFRAWQHLQLAGLVNGSFTGVDAGANDTDVEFGENIPAAKISAGGYYIHHLVQGVYSGNVRWFPSNYGNMLVVGAKEGATWTGAALLSPEEAWNIDTKMDDGRPGQGIVMSTKGSYGATSGCNDSDDEELSEYALSNSTIACVLIYKTGL